METITLDIKDLNDCSAQQTEDISINPLPIAYFSTTDVCAGETVIFTDGTTPGDPLNTLDYYEWEFYDPTGTIDLNGTFYQQFGNPDPTHDYVNGIIETIGANVNAQIKVTDIVGCTDIYNTITSNSPIEIHPLPIVDFSSPDICEGEDFVFIDNTTMNNTIFSDN